jgi:hypothetical protein
LRGLLTVLAVVALLAAVPAARADGDPASDFLISQRVFLPYDTKIPKQDQQQLIAITQAAAKKGFPIRVAVIASEYDLGSVTVLWQQPQRYATFLGTELLFIHKGPLLTVMPNGMGFNYPKHDTTAAVARLAAIPVPSGSGGLALAATTAVQRLAAVYGVHVAAPASVTAAPASHRNRNDRIVIAAAAAALLLLGVAARLLLRRRRAA